MKIGILQTGLVPEDLIEEHGEYPNMFKKLLDGHDFEYEAYEVVNNVFPADIHACDGWLITGSRHGAYEDHPWIPPLEDFIREAYAANIPIVGICFGHQILAQALGGKVEKFGGEWGVGKIEYQLSNGNSASLLAMHQDQVVEKPKDAEVIATNDFCKYAGLSYKNRAMSYQPHPEFTPEYTKSLIDTRKGNIIPDRQADPALETLFEENNSNQIADEIANFFLTSET